jgi:hypothetical protein
MLVMIAAISVLAIINPVSASAKAKTQTYGSSKYSTKVYDLTSRSDGTHTALGRSAHTTFTSYAYVDNYGLSYRVAYDGGPYGDCHNNDNFDAKDSPKILYIRTYTYRDCKNPVQP